MDAGNVGENCYFCIEKTTSRGCGIQDSIVKNEEKTHGLTIIMRRKRYLCNLKELEDYADRN